MLHRPGVVNAFVNGTSLTVAKRHLTAPHEASEKFPADLAKPIGTQQDPTTRTRLGVKRSRVQIPAARLAAFVLDGKHHEASLNGGSERAPMNGRWLEGVIIAPKP